MASSLPDNASPSNSIPDDPFRPTIFELLASSQLRSLLSPSVRYTLSILAQRQPRVFLRIFNRFDELWALVMLAVERHYLRTWSASFAENFYGLKRRRRVGLSSGRIPPSARKSSQGGDKLSNWQVYGSLTFEVGLPYAQIKVHEWWERNGGTAREVEDLFDDDQGDTASSSRGSAAFTGDFDAAAASKKTLKARITAILVLLKARFIRAYPYLSTSWQVWLLSYHIRYLFSHTPYFRPWLSAMRLEMRRVGPQDYPESSNLPLLPPNLPNPLQQPGEFIRRMIRGGPYMFFESLKYLLPASIFFFKFLEWWYSSENPRRTRGGGAGGQGNENGGGVAFGPPKVLLPSEKGVVHRRPASWKDPQVTITPPAEDDEDDDQPPAYSSSPADGSVPPPKILHNSCPLCGTTPMNNPAVLPTGYAFCYTCINPYVEAKGRCPVSGKRVIDGVDGVRRVVG